MAKKVNQTEVQQEVEQVVEETVQNTELVVRSTKEIVKHLIAAGATRITNVQVKNVNVEAIDDYHRVSLTLTTPIPGFVSDDNGATYKKGVTTVMFTTNWAIAGCLREDEDYAWLGSHVSVKPKSLKVLLSGAKIDILQQVIGAGEEYKNPFSTRKDVDAKVYDHETIINNIIGIKFSKTGERAADNIMDHLLNDSEED